MKYPVKSLSHISGGMLVSLMLIMIPSCKKENETINQSPYNSQNAYEIKDVSYGTDIGQKMDVYLPANRSSASTKVFVLVHGGGWTAGDKADMISFYNSIKSLYPRHAIINLNYRLATSSSAAYPKQIEDIKSAIRKIKESQYQVSPQYFFLGASAGAHLSLLYAYASDEKQDVKAVCNIVGPADFSDSAYSENPLYSWAYQNLIGVSSYQANPQLAKEASPALRVTALAPKTISFYGNADPLIPSSQMGRLHDKLDAQGIYNESTMYEGGHGNWNAQQNEDCTAKLITFINKYFNY